MPTGRQGCRPLHKKKNDFANLGTLLFHCIKDAMKIETSQLSQNHFFIL